MRNAVAPAVTDDLEAAAKVLSGDVGADAPAADGPVSDGGEAGEFAPRAAAAPETASPDTALPKAVVPEPVRQDPPAPAPTPAAQPQVRAGARLRAAREAQGKPLEDIAKATLVKIEYLQALEDMNLKLVPGKAYAHAYLRSYCKEVGLNPRDLAAEFELQSASAREDVRPQLRVPISKPNQERPWLTFALVAVISIGFVGWQLVRLNQRANAPVAEVPHIPLPKVTAGPEAPPAFGEIGLRALLPTRITVYAGGVEFLRRDLVAGQVETLLPAAGWKIGAEDGAAIELTVDGVPAGLLSDKPGRVIGRGVETILPLAQTENDSPILAPPAASASAPVVGGTLGPVQVRSAVPQPTPAAPPPAVAPPTGSVASLRSLDPTAPAPVAVTAPPVAAAAAPPPRPRRPATGTAAPSTGSSAAAVPATPPSTSEAPASPPPAASPAATAAPQP